MSEEQCDLFISYERKDAGGYSLSIYQHLSLRFGEKTVFRDKQDIHVGATWQDTLRDQVTGCKGFVVIVGPDWNHSRIQQKLNDPENWVRKEIECALANDKPVFPVLMGGVKDLETDKLPEPIQSAFTDNNYFIFQDGPEWQQALDRLCKDIANRTGLSIAGHESRITAPSHERLISRLDRNRETICVKQNFKSGRRLFLATGGQRAGFRHFAVRCALDALNQPTASIADNDSRNYREVSLNWSRFAELDASDRRSELLCDITEQLLNIKAVGTDDQLIQKIRQKIAGTRQPTIVYSTVRQGSGGSPERINEWFSIWKTLMPQASHPTGLAVILFIRQGFMRHFLAAPKRPEMCDCLVDPALALVTRVHLEEWTENQLKDRAGGALYLEVKNRGRKLFRFPWSKCHFEDISDAVEDIWITNGN